MAFRKGQRVKILAPVHPGHDTGWISGGNRHRHWVAYDEPIIYQGRQPGSNADLTGMKRYQDEYRPSDLEAL